MSAFSLSPPPARTAPMCPSKPQEDTVFLSLPCLDLSGGHCRLWGSVLSSLRWIHEPLLCLPGLTTSSPGRYRSGGRTPEGHGHPAASHARLILPADASKLTCFYNSRANISCAWSRDGGLQVTTCHIHAQPDKRCVWGLQTNVWNLREVAQVHQDQDSDYQNLC